MGKRWVVFLFLIAGVLIITACSKDDNENSNGEQFDINAKLSLDNLSGMFYGFRSDFGGNECGGICWDIYTFLQGNKVLVGVPANGGPEKIDCTVDSCQDYTIENGQLIIGSDSFPIEIIGDTLRINDVQLTRVTPVPEGTVFNNQYKYISYSGLIGITGGASSKTLFLTLNPDGTFELNGVSIGSVGGLSGTNTSGGFTDDTQVGTYTIENNTIELTGSDGTVENILFFIHDGNVNDIQLGERNYYVDED
ncbi:hypothetical protein [Ornithinibacillus halotolerans]|uniref:Lipoprotein n=1 Tax=Ornithinibacillus halotolerans TaxID=1274357 RepID=A0A916RX21_9BACI|nr:hypothetical protein [Ornithinibacillus halotolerans]GGA74948.1 hypothetical protein GCM10008025_18330 [Ornithinibacillus halotolerans]